MSRKLVYFTSFVLLPGLVLTSAANAADPDLVGYWNLDETSGTTAHDASGNGNDGTLIGDPQWVAGRLGGAVEFDGDGDWVDIGNDPIFNITDQITAACWIKVNQFTVDWQAIFTMGDDSWRLQRQTTTDNLCWACTGVTGTPGDWWLHGDVNVNDGEWHHIAGVYDGTMYYLYVDGDLDVSKDASGTINSSTYSVFIGANAQQGGREFDGLIDDVRVYKRALMDTEILGVMSGGGVKYPHASGPEPKNGDLYADTWVTLSWRAGDFTVSHDVYMGMNFDDVNNAARDSDVFRGNQGLDTTYYFAGFAPGAYPDGLVPGTTYYWRIDEVNDTEPNSPWKGEVWSFMIPPKTAYFPEPADGAEFVDLNVRLTWTAGYGAKLHYVVFGEDFDEVSSAAAGVQSGSANYSPGPLKLAKTYYWRVDESDGFDTLKGEVWSFTTEGAVSGPNPADKTVDVKPSVVLSWAAGAVAASHEVYFGMDADTVANATTTSPEYKGTRALGEESYDPGKLTLNTKYYWRIDEVNDASGDSPWPGNIWSFTTGDFFVIDDFEHYDANNPIWEKWIDGLGYGVPGTPNYFAGNGTGAAVGDETTASTCEETIVHGGNQSMPYTYDNNKQGYANYSQAEHTLTDQRDWTAEGVAELSLWFRGYPGSVGSFAEGPVGTYTMTASGADIWGNADEFHYAYKMLTGVGSIVAKVESVDNTNGWAKAGVMIRETLEPGSVHATMVVTPAQGVSFQRRPSAYAASTSANSVTGDEVTPYWIKIERDLSGNFTAHHSANGSTWTMQGAPENIQMSSNVYIGLAVTSHDPAQTCQAVFTNVTIIGNVGGQWVNQDIGIESNDAEPLYVAVFNTAGQPAVVVHTDPAAAQIDTWTEWVIPLSDLADQGIALTDVDRIAIGLGTRDNVTIPGGSGKMYFDDIRLTRPEETAAE